MADALVIPGDSNHEYHVRATVMGFELDLLVDTGFTHDGCLIGVALDEASYRGVRSRLRNFVDVSLRSLGPASRFAESGIGVVALVGLEGSEVETRIVNAGANLLGVCYFHRLPEFSILWDMANRTMSIGRMGSSLGT